MEVPAMRACSPITGFTLFIAEKPKAAKAIATALFGKPLECRRQGVPYWVAYDSGRLCIVASAAGHLFSLASLTNEYPIFEYEWVVRWKVERGSRHLRKFYSLLEWLSKFEPKNVINACDFDVEGSVIGYNVIRFILKRRDYFRMKFSSLTEDELARSYRNLLPPDANMVEAGLCRHELDWIWGINASRLLMDVYREALGRRRVLSLGRVQTPTLVEAINRFVADVVEVAEPKYTVSALLKREDASETFSGVHENSPFEYKHEASVAKSMILEAGVGIVKRVHIEKGERPPPPPFNLSDLQGEAYRLYGFSPYKTQKLAEKLYLEGLISYPRTESQRYPPDFPHAKVLERLKLLDYASEVGYVFKVNPGLKPREGKKMDPAHPAIYPTGKRPGRLSEDEKKVYDLVVRRYLASFMDPARITRLKALIAFKGQHVIAEGLNVEWRGWTRFYPLDIAERTIPLLREGDRVSVVKVIVREHWEKKKSRHTRASLLQWMESNSIGTESTRAPIIETLFSRGYLKEEKGGIRPTKTGLVVCDIASKYFSALTDASLTREFEEMLRRVRMGLERREDVLERAKNTVRALVEEAKSRFEDIKSTILLYEKTSAAKRCLVCELPATHGLCHIHEKALESLVESLNNLIRRTNLSREGLLSRIARNRKHGKAVREVATLILKGLIRLE